MDYTCFPFSLCKIFWNETLDLTITRKGFSSRKKFDTLCYFNLLDLKYRSFDLEINILTLKMKLNH